MNIKKKVGRRTIARLVASQTLFQYHFYKNKISLDQALDDTIEIYIKEECQNKKNYLKFVDLKLAKKLTNGVKENIEEIDQLIEKNLKNNHTLDSISQTVKEIIRLGVFELKNMPETSKKIIINEYVNLTSYFGEKPYIKFTNGILDNIAKQIRN